MNKLKLILSTVISTLAVNTYAQELPKFGELVKQYDDLSNYCNASKYTMGSFRSTPFIASYCDENFEKAISSSPVKLYLTEDDKSVLINYYKHIGAIEGLYLSIFNFGIGFAKNSNDETCAYAGCFFYNSTYNVNRMSEEDRARDVIESAIIPILQNTGEYLTKISHPYVMIGMGYLTKNAIDGTGNGAAVYCIIPVKDIIDFNALEITSKELLSHSKIYVKDVGDLKLMTF